MNPEDKDRSGHSPLAALPGGRIDGREAFRERVRETLACAVDQGWKEACFCDPDFADWPLGEREVEASLHAWARAGGRFTLIAQRWDEVLRRHARFVGWRQRWSHVIESRGVKGVDASAFPSAIWTPGFVLERLDLERSIGLASADPQRRQELRERLDQWLHLSSPAFSATTLGL